MVNDFSKIEAKWLKNMPVIIPTFNQLTLCKNTISRLKDFGLINFILLDNGSTYQPFIDWIKEIEYPVVIDNTNPGPRNFFVNNNIWNRLPNTFIVTDPDLEYPSSIPPSLINDMLKISNRYCLPKVALGLNTEPSEKMHPMVKNWERDYWVNILGYTEKKDPIYFAKTDTTFALYNKKFVTRPGDLSWDGNFFTSPRICGRYLCNHLGWYIDSYNDDESIYYKNTAAAWSSTVQELNRNKI